MDTPLHIVISKIKNTLKNVYSNPEIQELSFIIFNHVVGLSKVQCIAERNHPVNDKQIQTINAIVDRLKNEEPIEYIVGVADFYSYSFKVNPSVLIPRPETEELVEWIYNTNKLDAPKILDIGTGSGCIAITLNLLIENAEVCAIDISESALETAKINNTNNNTNVNFIKHDILQDNLDLLPNKLDILVSNPPYVRNSEKKLMYKNVLDYEPHTALFVNDNDPLVFYEAIADKGTKLLKPNGFLFFEINEALANGVSITLLNNGYKNIEIKKDINGKDRMVKAQL